MAANASYNDTDDCFCECEEAEFNNSMAPPSNKDEAEQAASQLAAELKVDTANLSSTTRKKNSAPDNRPSAQGIGMVGVIVIVTVVLSVVILDLTVLTRDIKYAVSRLLGLPHDSKAPYRRRRFQRNRRGPSRVLHRESIVPTHFYRSFREPDVENRRQSSAPESVELSANVGLRKDNVASGPPPLGGNDKPDPRDIQSRREFLLMQGARQ